MLRLYCWRPGGVERLWPVLFHWDWIYWIGNISFSLSGGFMATLSLTYNTRYTFQTIGNISFSLSRGFMATLSLTYNTRYTSSKLLETLSSPSLEASWPPSPSLKYDWDRLNMFNKCGWSVYLFVCRSVEPEHAGVAGMFGSAAMGSGILVGIGFSALMPNLVSYPAMDWELPDFWPAFND